MFLVKMPGPREKKRGQSGIYRHTQAAKKPCF